MKTGYTSCDDCAYGQICKVPEEKRSACVMHTETEAQNFRKNTILGLFLVGDLGGHLNIKTASKSR